MARLKAKIAALGLQDVLAVSGHPSWSFLSIRDAPGCTMWQLKTLLLQELFARGILTLWEKVEKNQGMQGIALVVDPKSLDRAIEDEYNYLFLVKAAPNNTVSYWAGFFWDKSGQFPSYQAFQAYVDQFAQGLQAPVTVKVTAE